MLTGLSPSTFTKLQLNAGALFKNLDYSTATDKASLATLLATALSGTSCIGATRGGGSFEATPSTREIEADGKRGAFVGSTIIDGWDVKLKATLIEMTADHLKDALGAATVTTTGSKSVIELNNEYASTDYIDHVCWVGDLSDGGYVLIEIDKALATGGLSLSFADKGEGTVPIELLAHNSTVAASAKAPCRIVFFS